MRTYSVTQNKLIIFLLGARLA